MASKIKLSRGTSYPITFTYMKNGVASNLTGATVYFTVKSVEADADATDSTAIILKTVTSHTDPVNGVTVISLSPTDTAYIQGTTSFIAPGEYLYDIKVKESGGAIYKAAEGGLTVDASPTNRGL